MPASTSARICSGLLTAGPRVQTIFALRTRRPYFSDDERTLGGRDGSRQGRRAGEVVVDRGGRRTALGYRPDDEGLPAPGVTCDEDTRHRGHVGVVADDVAALVQLHLELGHDAVLLGAREAH